MDLRIHIEDLYKKKVKKQYNSMNDSKHSIVCNVNKYCDVDDDDVDDPDSGYAMTD